MVVWRSRSYVVLLVGFVLSSTALSSLKNGASLVVERAGYAPRSSLVICFSGGPAQVPPDKQGLTAVLQAILDEGPSSSEPEEYLQQLFLLDGSIDLREINRGLLLEIKVPDDKFKDGLMLARDLLSNPKLNSEVFSRAIKTVLSETKNRQEDMAETISFFATRNAFGNSPDAFDGQGTVASVKSITLEDLKSYYPKVLDLRRTSFWYVGNLSQSEVESQINRSFLANSSGSVQKTTFTPANFVKPDANSPKVTLIQRADSPDNQIFYLFPENVVWDSDEKAQAEVLNEILGGGLTGRLATLLREKRGLTYHAGSSLHFSLPAWDIWTFGITANVEKLMAGVDEVLARFHQGSFTAREVKEAKMQVLTSFLQDQELPQDRLVERIRYGLFGRDPAFLSHYPAAIEAVSVASIRQFLKQKHFSSQDGRIYLMGDEKALLPILKKRHFSKEQVKVVSIE